LRAQQGLFIGATACSGQGAAAKCEVCDVAAIEAWHLALFRMKFVHKATDDGTKAALHLAIGKLAQQLEQGHLLGGIEHEIVDGIPASLYGNLAIG
jgi:hypothetical protein